MPGMAHDHSAMHHSAVGGMTLVVQARSCQSDCAVAERQNTPRKIVPHVTIVQTGAAVLDASPKFLDRDLEGAWSLDSGPPSFPSAHAASFSILHI
jgi:2'-5' RNA ligase